MTIRYFVRSWGEPNNPPLVLLHGFLGDSRDFETMVPPLLGQVHCLAIDLPGHGRTQVLGKAEQYSFEKTAPSLMEFLLTQTSPPWHLCGYSLGGRLALYLTLRFAPFINKLILISASPGLKTLAEQHQRRVADQHWLHLLQHHSLPEFLHHWYAQPLFTSLCSQPDFGQLYQRRLENSPCHLRLSLSHCGLGHQPSLWPELVHGVRPLLALVGEQDEKFCLINRALTQLYPQALYREIPHSGHGVPWEKPQIWGEDIKTFLKTMG